MSEQQAREARACNRCAIEKPLSEFTKDNRTKSGFSGRCKACHRRISAKYQSDNPERRKQTSAQHYNRNKPIVAERNLAWRIANPEKYGAIQRKHKASAKTKAAVRAYVKKHGLRLMHEQRARHPDRYRARNKVNNAIASGKLLPASSQACASCGGTAKEYHHHKGYEEQFWLAVIPVCKSCHVKEERKK